MYRPGRQYDDMVSAISMPEFDDGEEYYGPRNHDFLEQPSHRNKLPSLEESSPLMSEEDKQYAGDEGQYSGQDSEPEWKATQRLSQMRQSDQFGQSHQMRHSRQMNNSQLYGGGDRVNMRDGLQQSFQSYGSHPRQQLGYPMQRRDFNQNTLQVIRQSNTSSHMSSQSHRSSQFSIDDMSEMTGTITGTLNDTTRALRSSVNDSSTLDTVTLRSNGQHWSQGVADPTRRLSGNSVDYQLPTAKGIDLCADDDDPLNAPTLDTTSIGQITTSKRRRKMKICCGFVILLLLLGAITVTILFVTGVISLDDVLFWQNKQTLTIPVQNTTSNSNDNHQSTMTLEEIGRVTAQPTKSSYPSIAPSFAPSNKTMIDSILDISPDDLEGKCSPSNFPYTVDVCRESCIAAECCYLNGEDAVKGCFDTSTDTYNGRLNSHRCTQYRPHCDVFYDTWSGAEDGYIRPAPHNLHQLCRKRLNLGANQTSRTLDFEDDICLDACLPSKCCQAMKVAGESDTESIISYLGYVMTSCEDRNEEDCRAYNATCFGIFEEPPPPDTSPSVSPSIRSSSSSNTSTSVFESSSPTLTSTSSLTSDPGDKDPVTNAGGNGLEGVEETSTEGPGFNLQTLENRPTQSPSSSPSSPSIIVINVTSVQTDVSGVMRFSEPVPQDTEADLIIFLDALMKTIRSTVTPSLNANDQLIYTEIISIDGKAVDSLLLRRFLRRWLQTDSSVVYNIVVLTDCDLSGCTAADSVAYDVFSRVKNEMTTSVDSGTFASALGVNIISSSGGSLEYVTGVKLGDFSEPTVTVLSPMGDYGANETFNSESTSAVDVNTTSNETDSIIFLNEIATINETSATDSSHEVGNKPLTSNATIALEDNNVTLNLILKPDADGTFPFNATFGGNETLSPYPSNLYATPGGVANDTLDTFANATLDGNVSSSVFDGDSMPISFNSSTFDELLSPSSTVVANETFSVTHVNETSLNSTSTEEQELLTSNP